MREADAALGAVKETTVFLSYFKDLPDYRQKGKVAYPLEEVLLLMLAAALAGAETVADIARFGRAKLAFLQRFRLFANGTPSHDQLGIILAKLNPVAFQRCFVAWTAVLTESVGRSDRHRRQDGCHAALKREIAAVETGNFAGVRRRAGAAAWGGTPKGRGDQAFETRRAIDLGAHH